MSDGKYATAIFDPPWWESGGGKVKRGADRHYPLMKTAAIAALPISALMLPNAHMYLWATNNHLPDALEVMKAWGFRYVTCITWGKGYVDAVNLKIQTGLGQYFRGSTEHLLFGVRGRVPYKVNEGSGKRQQGRTLYLAPRAEHSEKPERFREVVEHVSAGPYLEGFARRRVPGWDAWGPMVDHAGGAIEGGISL
jgi:N6-adenosine-specific RNA methylase IME4